VVDSLLTVAVIGGQDEKVIQASCGGTHTLVLTASGKVFAAGRGKRTYA